jgi:uncharacterized protein DUF6166
MYAAATGQPLTLTIYHMTKEQFLKALPEHIHVQAKQTTKQVYIDGVHLIPDGSLRIRNHCREFAWGYSGSGPAQFALALLMLYVDADTAQEYYQELKAGWVAVLPQRNFDLHVNFRWVMETIFQYDNAYEASKLIKALQ